MPPVVRVPSRELLQLLRQSPTTSLCTRSRLAIHPIRNTSRAFSTTHFRHADSTTTSRASRSGGTRGDQNPNISSTSPSSPSSPSRRRNPYAPTTHDRGPASEEDTQTDFGAMDIYSNTPEPATSIDACTPGGFHMNNGTKITGGSGVLLAGGEAWTWKPWLGATQSTKEEPRISHLLDARGLLVIPPVSLSVLKFLHPKPDLLLMGTGSRTLMLHPDTRKYIVEELGMRIDVMDTANASAAYNLLATERGVEGGGGVGGAMLPVGWKGVEVRKR